MVEGAAEEAHRGAGGRRGGQGVGGVSGDEARRGGWEGVSPAKLLLLAAGARAWTKGEQSLVP